MNRLRLLSLLIVLQLVIVQSNFELKAQSSIFETITTSNLNRLESLIAWKSDGQLFAPPMLIVPAEQANFALIENRLHSLLGTIDLDNLQLLSTFDFVTTGVIFREGISPDGQFGAVSDLHLIDVWNTATGYKEFQIRLPSDEYEVNDIDFSSNSDLFAYVINSYPEFSSQDGVYIYDLNSGHQLKFLQHPSAQQVKFSSSKEQLVSAGYDGSVRLWDLKTDEVSIIRQADLKSVSQVDFADSNVIALSLLDDPIKGYELEYWNLTTNRRVTIDNFRNYSWYIRDGIAFAPLGRTTVLQLWSVFSGEDLALLMDAYVDDILPEQNLLITTDLSGIHLLELNTGKIIHTISESHLTSARFSFDGRYLLLWGREGIVEVWGVPAA